jgi:4-diphosphocytidyl-2-C-methyl-D-erythritol kinase
LPKQHLLLEPKISKAMKSIDYRSYAKINLYLDVLSKREDGFHAIETIFQSISFHDTLRCAVADTLSLEVEGADLSPGKDNLVYRAATLLQHAYKIKHGAHMTLEKHIPIAAGLAGGSGNAAAALVALNELWDINAPINELEDLAAQLGSDIPYCLSGGTQAGINRGETLSPIAPLPKTWFVLAHPPIAVSTPAIYNHPKLFKSGATPGPSGMSSRLEEAIQRCEEAPLGSILFNAMEFAALVAFPIIEEYKARLSVAGCDGVLMSGSGPTCFGICKSESHAYDVKAQLHDIESTIVHSVDTGLERFGDNL